MDRSEVKKLLGALWIPLLYVILIALLYFIEEEGIIQIKQWGIRPREWKGLIGIVISPLLHGSLEHLFNNSIPLLVLGWSTMYFYRELFLRVVVLIVLFGGIWVWLSARADTNHIGASGLIYGLVTFLFFSGIIRRYKPLIAISLLVAFMYGSFVWGVLPIREEISWEGHLWGAIAGVVLAYYYKPEGPQRPRYEWEDEDDDDEYGPWNQQSDEESKIQKGARPYRIVYHVKKKKKDQGE